MQIQRLAGAVLAASFIAFPLFLISEEPGAPTARSGGDFPGEQNCTDGRCHNDGLPNTGGGSVAMLVNGEPLAAQTYDPGQVIPITVQVEDPGAQRWGFQLTARSADECTQAGSLTPGDASVRIDSEPVDACGGNVQEWATHVFPKAGGNNTFLVNWMAPEEGFGDVRFAASGNGANGDTRRTGDNIYILEATVQPGAPNTLPQPAVGEGAIILANLLPSVAAGSPRGLLTAFGTNLAAPATFETAQLDDQGRITEQLGGTCVEVSGRRSPLLGVTETQVSFQPSHLTGLGPAEVVVINNCDTAAEMRSAPTTVNIQREAPGFLVMTFTDREQGRNPIAAIHNDDFVRVGPTDLFGGNPATRPARRGDIIQLFATGFGETDRVVEAGEVPGSNLARIVGEIQITIGGVPVPAEDIFFVGAAPCCASLDQVTLRIPDGVPDGDQEVVITINGVSSPAGPVIRIEGSV